MANRIYTVEALIKRGYRTQSTVGQYNGCAVALFLTGALMLPALAVQGLISIETVNMAGRYFAFGIVALGLDLIWGYTGILSLCQSLFFALGGYAMGMYLAHQGNLFNGIPEALYVVYPYEIGESKGMEVLPWFWLPFKSFNLTLLLGTLIPGLVAGVIGFSCFVSRVRGVYFSILTQAFTVAAWMFFSKNDMKLCGTNGLTHFKTIAGNSLQEDHVKIGLYVATLVSLIGVYCLCSALVRSRFGRVLVAIRDSEMALRFTGYQPFAYKTAIFALSGAIAGLAGMLYTPQASIVTPSYMEARWSILMVVWVAVGGRGSLGGAVLGALLVNLLYSTLTSQHTVLGFTWRPDYWPFVIGFLFVFVVLVLPGGLIGLWKKYLARIAVEI